MNIIEKKHFFSKKLIYFNRNNYFYLLEMFNKVIKEDYYIKTDNFEIYIKK